MAFTFHHLVLDFACYSARVVIEVDGGPHNMTGQHLDAARDRFLRENDFRVLRFWNNDVLRNIDGVAHEIYIALGLARDTSPPRKGGGE
jgi:very-short-patch-repair endonuclease